MAIRRPTAPSRLLFLACVTVSTMAPLAFACSSFGTAPAADGGASATEDASEPADRQAPVDDASVAEVSVPEAAPPVDAGALVHVFVTRATIIGRDLSKDPSGAAPPRNPITQATQMCMSEALAAGLTGTYTPWIGTSASPPGQRLFGNGPWFDASGKSVVFSSRPDKGGVIPLQSIVPASGLPIAGVLAWTGQSADDTCGDWADGLQQARLGNPNDRLKWETSSYGQCGTTAAAIYCFEQPPPEISPGTGGN